MQWQREPREETTPAALIKHPDPTPNGMMGPRPAGPGPRPAALSLSSSRLPPDKKTRQHQKNVAIPFTLPRTLATYHALAAAPPRQRRTGERRRHPSTPSDHSSRITQTNKQTNKQLWPWPPSWAPHRVRAAAAAVHYGGRSISPPASSFRRGR